jgi:hypothetical protein
MLRFLRILVITVVLALAAGYGVTWFMSGRIIERVRGILDETLVKPFNPGESDQYGYKVNLHLWPLTVEIGDFHIKAKSLEVDGDTFDDADLKIGKIVLELLPLLREKKLKILEKSGMEFTGLLSPRGMARRLERTGGALSGLEVDEFNRKARVKGRFGNISITTMTVTGVWKIDDRRVITLADRTYTNPDSYVPLGVAQILEREINFDIRIHILDTEMIPESVKFSPAGLCLSLHD